MKRRSSVRGVLNELRWHPERDPSRARVFYANRAAAEGFTVVGGDEVEDIGPSSFTVGGSTIPYYKVFRITDGSEVLFERRDEDEDPWGHLPSKG